MPSAKTLNARLVTTYNQYLRFANAARKADHDVRMRAMRLERSGPATRDMRARQLQEAQDRLTRTTIQRDAAWQRHTAIADAWAVMTQGNQSEDR